MKFKSGFGDYSATQLADTGDKVTKNATGAVWTPLASLTAAVGTAVTNLRNAMSSTGAGKTEATQEASTVLAQALTAFAKAVTHGAPEEKSSGVLFALAA